MKAQFRFLCLSLALLCFSAASQAQLSGTITVPSTTYPDLASVITALNTSGVGTGGATIVLSGSNPQTAPSGGYKLGSATLNASLSSGNPLVFNGNGNTITGPTGTGSNDGIWWLLGTDYVTINSFSLVDVSTTTTTTSTPGNEWGFMLGKRNTSSPYDGCQHVTINNCSISLNGYQSSSTGIYVAHANATSTSISTSSYGPNDANSYNKFTANTITNVCRGIYINGSSSSVANYDKQNEIGGTTSASGNNITVGGNSGTSVKYGIYIYYDSVTYVRNNDFAISTAQTGNATTYGLYWGPGRGDMNVLNNYFNMTSPNTTGTIGAVYITSSRSDAGATYNITNNEVTGNGLSVTSASFYGIYLSNAICETLNLNYNNVHDINWAPNNVTGSSYNYVYAFYPYYNGCSSFNMNYNRVNNISRNGPGYIYLSYNYQYNCPANSTFTMKYNVFKNISTDQTTSTGSNFIYGMYNWSNYTYNAQADISHNKMDSIDVSGVTSTYSYIYNYIGYYFGDSSRFDYDTFTNWFGYTGTSRYTYFYNFCYQYYGKKASSFSHAYIDNWQASSAYAYNYLGYYHQHVDSNIIQNIHLGMNGGNTGQIYNFIGYYADSGTANGNKLYNLHTEGANQYIYNYLGAYGQTGTQVVANNSLRAINSGSGLYNYIGYYGYGDLDIHDNRLDSIVVSSTSQPLIGCYLGISPSGGNYNFYRNVVSNLSVPNSTSASQQLYGLYVTAGGAGKDMNFYNNEVTNLDVPSTYGSPNYVGIFTTGNADYKFYNNTVRMSPTSSPTGSGFCATGLYYYNTGTLDLRNNILYVNALPGSGGSVAALRRNNGTTGTPPSNFLATSNSNIYYAPNATNSYLYAEGSITSPVNTYNLSNDPNFNNGSCGLFKSFVGHDLASMTENNLTASGSVANAYVPSGTSYAEKGGTATSNPAITTDLAGVTRGTPVDIGALEFSGTVNDNAAPQISYTPLVPITFCTNQPTIVATITDQTGVDTNAGTKPRLYYKKSTENNTFGGNTSASNNWKYVEPTSISGSTFTFTMDYSKLTGTISGGTVIQYFVIAQDVTSSTYTGAVTASFGGSCPTSVNLSSANAPVNASPAPDSFTIQSASSFVTSASMSSLCVSGSVTINLNPAPSGATMQWQSSSSLSGPFTNITGATTPTYVTPVLTATTYYRAVIYCGSSVLTTTTPYKVTVNNPILTAYSGATRCGFGQVTLNATPSAGARVNWYATATSPNPIATGNSFTTPNLGSSVTYYATATVPGGSIEHLGLVPSTYYSYTSPYYGYGEIFKFQDTTNFYSTTVYPQTTGQLTLTLVDNDPSSANYGNVVKTSATINITTASMGSLSAKLVINLNWTNIPPGEYILVADPSSTSSSLYLHYNYQYPNIGYPYYSSVTGRAQMTGAVIGGTTPYTYYYWFFYDNVISGPCESGTRVPITATVNPSTPIFANSVSAPGICTGDSAVLTATSTNGTYLYSWYSPNLGGSLAGTGTPLTVYPTAKTCYYAYATDVLSGCTAVDSVCLNVTPKEPAPSISPVNPTICQNAAVQLTATPVNPFGGTTTLGTGTSSSSAYYMPFYQFYTASHNQYMIHASELTALGMGAGPINSLAFYLNSTYYGNAMKRYTIKMANTSTTTASTSFVCTGLTTVYGPSTFTPSGTGWQTFTFSTPFVWNGTSNVIVDVSFDNDPCNSDWSNAGDVRYTSTSFTSSAGYWADGNCTIQTCSPSGASSFTSTIRPNMLFGWGNGYVINWVPNVTGLYKNYPPASNPVSTSDGISTVWASPSTTQVYTAVVNANGCLSNPSNPDTVNVNAAPPTTITPAGPQAICSGNSVTLCAPSGATMTYQWYNGATAIAGATGNCYTATTAGNYSVQVTNANTGCTAKSAVTAVTVNTLPTVSISAGGPINICNGDSVVLSSTTNAGAGAIYQWYDGTTAIGAPQGTGPSFTAKSSGSFHLEVTKANGCTGISTPITVNVTTVPGTVTPSGTTTFCTGGSVQLCAPTSGAGSPYTYQWYSSGSAISSATSSCYTASTSGIYTVTVSSASTGCATTSTSTTVTVGAAPSSAITPSGSVVLCSSGSVTLTTNSAPGLSYQWYKNGTAITGANSSTLVVSNIASLGSGNYTVNVSITLTPSCNSTTASATSVSLSPTPTASFTAGSTTTFCAGDSVLFTYSGTTGVSYQWNVNGAPISGAIASTYKAKSGGSYTVTATTGAGCADTSNPTLVTVNPLPSATITASGPTAICSLANVSLCAPTGFVSYQWKVGGVNVATGGSSACYSASATGNYTVSVTDNNGCSNTSVPVGVLVNPLPVVTTSPTDTITICGGTTTTISGSPCNNTTYSYMWRNLTGYIGGATSCNYTTGTPGVYRLKVTDNLTGCADSSKAVTVITTTPPPATATRVGAATICDGDSSLLNANTGTGLSYQWNYNGSPIAGATAGSYYAKAQGSYTVTVSLGTCSSTSAAVSISVNPAPASYITYNTPLQFCEGSAVALNANIGTGITYLWYLNDTPTTNNSTLYVAMATGVYSLRTTNSLGCSSFSDTLHVTVWPAPHPTLSTTDVTMTTTQTYASYQWFLNNVAIGGATSQSYTATENGAYKVRVIDSNGCEGYSDLKFIQNVGITPTATSLAIKVYPNPTTGILKIDAPVKVKLALHDVTGKVVAEAVDVKQLDISRVANGTYLLFIYDMNGNAMRIDKVTKTAN
ncbi:MAG: hypothetical protein JST27_09095 [Bacteroidetes bacterium]|nr:hypothetical protein [Bacteroidota bacterium]